MNSRDFTNGDSYKYFEKWIRYSSKSFSHLIL